MDDIYRVKNTGSPYLAVQRIVAWLGMGNGYRVHEMHWESVPGSTENRGLAGNG